MTKVEVGLSKIAEKTTYTRNKMLKGFVAPPEEFKIKEIKMMSKSKIPKREYSWSAFSCLNFK